MSASAEGSKLIGQIKQLEDRFDTGTKLPDAAAPGAPSGEAATFPARYFLPSDRDDQYEVKDQLASAARPAMITDQDVEYVLKKRDAVESYKFENWFNSQWKFDSDNPTMQRWAQQMLPELFSKREQVIDDQAEIQKRLAKMKLYGIRDRADLELLYAIDAGLAPIPNEPLHKLGDNVLSAQESFSRGLFNPRKRKILEQRPTVHDPALAGAYGTGTGINGPDRGSFDPVTHQQAAGIPRGPAAGLL